jgi:hypothetical protein
MPSFRILDQFPAFLGPDGRPVVGGELRFYESGTTRPKDVYADPGMTVNNGSTVQIGSDGRTVVDVWGDGAYRVRLYAADGTLVAEADDVEIPGGATANIPVPEAGEFLTGDGTQFLVQTLLLLPDPTGQDGKMLVANGSGYSLESVPSPPEPPSPDIQIDASRLVIGDGSGTTKVLIQTGNGVASGGGGGVYYVSSSITFPTAYDALWYVAVIPTATAVNAGTSGRLPACSVTGWVPGSSAATVTANFATTEDDIGGGSNIQMPVPFAWFAIGTITVSGGE